MNQMGIMKSFNEAREQDERNRQLEIERLNKRNGISTTPQLSAAGRKQFLKDYLAKQNQQS